MALANSVRPTADLTPIPVAASRTVHTHLIRPDECDHRSVAFGGTILAFVDIIAGVSAAKVARGAVVTQSLDSVSFLEPARQGDMLIVSASVNRCWKSSLEAGVRVEAENCVSGARRFVCQAYLTFVALDPTTGKSVSVPPVVPETDAEKQRHALAETRRQARTASRTPPPPTVPGVPLARAVPRAGPPRAGPDGSLARPSGDSYVESVHSVFPHMANHTGNTFGGSIMRLMEQAAVLSGYRHARSPVVTASFDRIAFMGPSRTGDLLVVRSWVTAAWGASCEVYAQVAVQSPRERRAIVDGYVTMVALDSSGSRVGVPAAVPETEEEKQKAVGATDRRKARLEQKRLLESRPETPKL
ncbi:HotDog domain-containing protein [Hyaloraphidium curvatum]|nr:HotDog domain-containing protein [Hyaloraphidium curvatum]